MNMFELSAETNDLLNNSSKSGQPHTSIRMGSAESEFSYDLPFRSSLRGESRQFMTELGRFFVFSHPGKHSTTVGARQGEDESGPGRPSGGTDSAHYHFSILLRG